MALRLGNVARNFSAAPTEGTIDFHQRLGNSWGVLFSHLSVNDFKNQITKGRL